MDPLISERAMSYAEPPIYSSRDFVSVNTTEKPSNAGEWHKSSSRFSISLRNLAQNELIDVNTVYLQFGVVQVTQPGTDVGVTKLRPLCLQTSTAEDAASIFPSPHFGCPFFSSVSCQIPGLGLESFCRADVETQQMIASRLLCSSGEGSFAGEQARGGFKISGKAFAAGARDTGSRSGCLFTVGDGLLTNRSVSTDATIATATGVRTTTYGEITYYQVPLSLFTHLGNGLSSLLPLAYFASGGDLMTMTFSLAPATSALCAVNVDRPDLVGASEFYIVDPALSFTKLQINNPSVLAGLESLYRGLATIPIAPGVSAPTSMVLKDTDYVSAFTNVSGPSGAFQLQVPANEPSCRGIMIGFFANDIINAGVYNVGATGAQNVVSNWSTKYALGLQPKLRNLQIKIGSYRIPLDAISDLTYDPTSIPGVVGNPFTGVPLATKPISSLSTRREAQRLYQAGKHLFSPFASTETFEADALSEFWAAPVSRRSAATTSVFGPPRRSLGDVVVSGTTDYAAYSGVKFIHEVGPNIFVLPFETIAQVCSSRDDAYALRGLDLRNISSVSVSGIIDGVAAGTGPGLVDQGGDDTSTSGWTIRAWMALDREIVLLPGRVDLGAVFSLVPTGATSLPTSGNPSM